MQDMKVKPIPRINSENGWVYSGSTSQRDSVAMSLLHMPNEKATEIGTIDDPLGGMIIA